MSSRVLLHGLQGVHSAVGNVADIGRPAERLPIDPAEQHFVIFRGAGNGSMRGVGVEAARNAAAGGAMGHGVQITHQAPAPLHQVFPAGRHLDQAQHGAGKPGQQIHGGICFPPFILGFTIVIPVEHQRDAGQFNAVGLQRIRQSAGIVQIAHPEVHRLNAAETGLGNDLNHMVELVGMGPPAFFHEPGVNLSTKSECSSLMGGSHGMSVSLPSRGSLCRRRLGVR